ncbi:MAG: hypothetical protein R3C42_01565 [Parvularculaceae bacterium]
MQGDARRRDGEAARGRNFDFPRTGGGPWTGRRRSARNAGNRARPKRALGRALHCVEPIARAIARRACGRGRGGRAFPDEDRDLAAGAPVLWRGGELIGPAWEFGHSTPLADERFFRRVNRFAEIT